MKRTQILPVIISLCVIGIMAYSMYFGMNRTNESYKERIEICMKLENKTSDDSESVKEGKARFKFERTTDFLYPKTRYKIKQTKSDNL